MKSKSLAISGLLTALGILIPIIFAPYAIRIEPYASYTLASHVPVMVAMFFSPGIAVAVAVGTSLGFLITTGPIIFARAFSHTVFAYIGASYIKKNRDIINNKKKLIVFNLIISLIHVISEVIIVSPFFIGESFDLKSYLITVVGFIGLGGYIHSLIDFTIASIVVKRLPKF